MYSSETPKGRFPVGKKAISNLNLVTKLVTIIFFDFLCQTLSYELGFNRLFCTSATWDKHYFFLSEGGRE